MALITTVGAQSSNSFIQLDEAEFILRTLGLQTDAWLSLTASQSNVVSSKVAGPFTITPGINDNMSFSLASNATPQNVTFSGDPQVLTTTQFCIAVNAHLHGITFIPNPSGTIDIELTGSTDTLNIISSDRSLYSTVGLAPGSYSNSVIQKKEYMLQLAAQVVGLLPLSGRRIYKRQALCFPRLKFCIYDYTHGDEYYDYEWGYAVLDLDWDYPYIGYDPDEISTIPQQVKEAQAILACLVVQPSLEKQTTLSSLFYQPPGVQNAIVNDVEVAGIMTVKTTEISSPSAITTGTTNVNVLSTMGNVFCMPVYMRMKPWLTQVKGGSLRPPLEDHFGLLPPREAVEEYTTGLNLTPTVIPSIEVSEIYDDVTTSSPFPEDLSGSNTSTDTGSGDGSMDGGTF